VLRATGSFLLFLLGLLFGATRRYWIGPHVTFLGLDVSRGAGFRLFVLDFLWLFVLAPTRMAKEGGSV
jgi:hypothetical protein